MAVTPSVNTAYDIAMLMIPLLENPKTAANKMMVTVRQEEHIFDTKLSSTFLIT